MDRITESTAEQLLTSKISASEDLLRSYVRVPLTQNQFDALCDLTYNSGNAIHGSQLLQLLNAGDYKGAADNFKNINHSGGEVKNSLTDRREDEATLFRQR